MGKKSRKANKKSKVERDRNLSETSFDGFLGRIPRRSLCTTHCRHMTVVLDDALHAEQKKEVKVYLGSYCRTLYAFMEYGGESASSEDRRTNNLAELVSSPAACRNADGMAELLLATATDYLLEYEFMPLKQALEELLKARMVLVAMKARNVDPSNINAVLAQILLVGMYNLFLLFLSLL